MAEIAQRIFATDGTKSLLRLYNEEFVRPVNIPATWGRLRLALSVAVTDTGGNLIATNFFFGFCSTAASPFTSGSTIRAEGFEGVSSVMVRSGTTNPYYIFAGGTYYGTRRVSGVNNRSSAGIGSYDITATGGAINKRSLIAVDLVASTNGVTLFLPQSAIAVTDMSPSHFIEATETLPVASNAAPAAYGNIVTTPGGSSTATLDTVNIYWSNGLAPLEIYAMAVFVYPI